MIPLDVLHDLLEQLLDYSILENPSVDPTSLEGKALIQPLLDLIYLFRCTCPKSNYMLRGNSSKKECKGRCHSLGDRKIINSLIKSTHAALLIDVDPFASRLALRVWSRYVTTGTKRSIFQAESKDILTKIARYNYNDSPIIIHRRTNKPLNPTHPILMTKRQDYRPLVIVHPYTDLTYLNMERLGTFTQSQNNKTKKMNIDVHTSFVDSLISRTIPGPTAQELKHVSYNPTGLQINRDYLPNTVLKPHNLILRPYSWTSGPLAPLLEVIDPLITHSSLPTMSPEDEEIHNFSHHPKILSRMGILPKSFKNLLDKHKINKDVRETITLATLNHTSAALKRKLIWRNSRYRGEG